MRHPYEDSKIYNTTYKRYSGKVTFIRRWCKCGHSINFLVRTPIICRHCGNIVYPDDKYEFVEKMKKVLKK